MRLKVDWKLINDAERTGVIYWLSGWYNGEPGTKRWVYTGYYSRAEGEWIDEDSEPCDPTHFAEQYVPEPSTE